jgi:quercetin dioxygenase-like cupin family protein
VIHSTITVVADEMVVDYSGSSPQTQKVGVNCVLNCTRSFTHFPLHAALLPEIPSNEGMTTPIHITAPVGSVMNTQRPVPVDVRAIITHVLPDHVRGSPARMIAERVGGRRRHSPGVRLRRRGRACVSAAGSGSVHGRGERGRMSDLFTNDDFSEVIDIAPGVRTRVLTLGTLMFSLVELDDGAESPIHHHPEVQIGLVLEGAFERRQGDEVKLLQAGDGFYVPDVPHGGRAVGRCGILDVFSPPRDDRYVKAST